MTDDILSADRVGRYYDEWTGHYLAASGDTFQACRPTDSRDLHRYLLERSDIRDGERVLDAGCGVCGPSMFFARERNVSIDAITVSANQASTARHLVTEARLQDRIAVHHGDFHQLERIFTDSLFDRILFLESLSHSPDPRTALTAAVRVLKPGGVIYIKDFFEKQCDTEAEHRRVREVIRKVDSVFVLRTPGVRQTVGILEQLGLIQQIYEPVRFESDNAVWRRFNDAHNFDLYEGKPPSSWCDWFELRFEKPS